MKSANWFDSVVKFFAPHSALRRIQARRALSVLESHAARKYEGASTGNRLKNWKSYSTSAEAEVTSGLVKLRDRARDLARNDPHMSKALQVITGKTVGAGIVPQFSDKSENQIKKIEEAFNQWTNYCDFDADTNFYGLQAQVMMGVCGSGEILVRRIRTKPNGDRIPLQLQILEGDHLDHLRNEELANGHRIVQGIELDDAGKKVAYWIFPRHPGDTSAPAQVSIRVPESEIAHVFRKDRPGQLRGVPWAAPVIVKLRDFNDFEDAQLMRQKIAACFTAFVYDNDPTSEGEDEADLTETMYPGRVELLPPGKDIKFAAPPGVDGYAEYSTQVLRSIAAGLGITFESLTGDYSKANFSSSRMGWIETQPAIELWRWNMFIPLFCEKIMTWWFEAAALKGLRIDGVKVDWTPPAIPYIDPNKEISATKEAIRVGTKTLSQAIREQGYDPKKLLAERAADNKLIDKLGLQLDSDPRKVTEFGMNQSTPVGGHPEKPEAPAKED
jgi:lambda family phage portal protein